MQARRSAKEIGPVIDVDDAVSERDLDIFASSRTPDYTRKTVRTVNIKNGETDSRTASTFDGWKHH